MDFRGLPEITGSALALPFTAVALVASALICLADPGTDYLRIQMELAGIALFSSVVIGSALAPPPQGVDPFQWLINPSLKSVRRVCREPLLYAALFCLAVRVLAF